jgi:hypothetical protein
MIIPPGMALIFDSNPVRISASLIIPLQLRVVV